jgi:hypothetical protein
MRIWEFYLAYCEAAFAMGNIDLVQYTLRRAADEHRRATRWLAKGRLAGRLALGLLLAGARCVAQRRCPRRWPARSRMRKLGAVPHA